MHQYKFDWFDTIPKFGKKRSGLKCCDDKFAAVDLFCTGNSDFEDRLDQTSQCKMTGAEALTKHLK